MKSIARLLCLCLGFMLVWAARAEVGYFAPDGLPNAVIQQTRMGLFNAHDPRQVEENLSRLVGTEFKALVDLGPIIAQSRPAQDLAMRYVVTTGQTHTKSFAPQQSINLRVFPADEPLRAVLGPIFDVLTKYKANVGAVFVADEPYVHGLSKSELERAGRLVRAMLDQRGMQVVEIGVIFASAMFNAEFAQLMDRHSAAYVQDIDRYYAARGSGTSAQEFEAWVKAIEQHRLVTYDRAGNMYVGGGLPEGYDIYGFDFYLSTILLDRTHEDTLSWLAKRYPSADCARFKDQPMSRVRSQLSFFRDGPPLQDQRYAQADRAILDAMFGCRMNAMTEMLREAASKRKAKLLLVAESSNNGVLEFSSAAAVEPVQPRALIDARMLDEVKRAQAFYEERRCVYNGGMLFFTYQDSYDESIKLHVGGAQDAPTVLRTIAELARTDALRQRSLDCPSGARAFLTVLWKRWSAANPVPPLAVVPQAIALCRGDERVSATVSWRASAKKNPKTAVYVLEPGANEAKLFSIGGFQGTATTGNWVTAGTRFDLVDDRTGNSLSSYTMV